MVKAVVSPDLGLFGRGDLFFLCVFVRVSRFLESWELDILATLRRSEPPYTLTPKNLAATVMIGS